MGVNSHHHTMDALLMGKSLWHLLDRMPQSQLGHGGEEKISVLTMNQTPAIQPIASQFTNSAVLAD
jgi:hypothetical protein